MKTAVDMYSVCCAVYNIRCEVHILELTRAARVLDIVLSSQKEFVDNVEILEPFG